ncbi:MAG: cytochrome P450 [Pseudonocardiaceae bacterium]
MSGFFSDIAAAEQQTPLPPPPPPMPDSGDPKYVDAPELYEKDKQAAAVAAAAFAAAGQARGAAVAGVISKWLATAPYVMLQELLDQPKEQMPIFKPFIGPAVVARHEYVIECLQRTDLFTVDLYAPEMARATDDKAKNPQAFSHFMLSTDRDELYRLDDVILRRAVSRHDEGALSAMIRNEAQRWTRTVGDAGEIDVVTTLAKFVPLRIASDYLGVPYQDDSEPATIPGLHAGDRFPLDEDLVRVFSFSKIQEGFVPTADDLYNWIKDTFRNTFNNFNQDNPLFTEFRERGIVGTEYLTAYVHALLKVYKDRLRRGETVPDTMLTRLLRMQSKVAGEGAQALEQEFASLLGSPLPEGELARRLSDSMIRSNVCATLTGAVVNPQEATARIVDSILRLKDGEYEARNGSSYDHATQLAGIDEEEPSYAESLEALRKYALEALRLQPQGEVLLRLCAQDNTTLGGVPIHKGTPVFVAFAAAMRDAEAVPQPLAFDIARDERLTGYLSNGDRAREAPQSQTYLQHGYGRHVCLGRYASEITMRESLRALLRLGQLQRLSGLEMDEQGIYAVSLRVGFS